MVDITRHPREVVSPGIDFQWSKKLWVHNVFRVYEMLFGRRAGVRPDHAAGTNGEQYSYSWENLLAVYENIIRNLFILPKFRIVYVPQLQLAGMVRMGVSPFRFAIALDTSALSTEVNNTGQSWSHTQTGSNLILFAYDVAESTTTDPYSNMTYNSVAMTVGNSKASANRFCKAWYLTGAATGAHTIQPTLTSQFNQGASASYTGVNQSTVDNTSTASGTTANPVFTITPVAANCWTISGYVSDVTAGTAGTGTTTRQSGGAPMAIGDSNAPVTGGSLYTMNWTSNGNWGGVMISFAPVAATVNSGFFFFALR